jgi:N-methylhydantoinase A
LAGGAKSLDRALAQEAINRVIADPLGMTEEEAAHAVLQVANANMADAVRLISIRRGYDPRDFALIAFGGAGALHGAEVARELNIPTVVIPANPGVTSAMGCLLVDIRHDLSAMYAGLASETDPDDLEAEFRALETEATARLRHEGVSDEDSLLQRVISMRYQGQWRSLAVSMGAGQGALDEAIQTFHQEHEREFAFRQDDQPVEIYQLQLAAIGKTPKPSFAPAKELVADPGEPQSVRPVYFGADGWVQTPVYDRSTLPAGATFVGPAIIDQLDSTTVVPPRTTAQIDEWLNIRIHLTEFKNAQEAN